MTSPACPWTHLYCLDCGMEVCSRGQAEQHRQFGHILVRLTDDPGGEEGTLVNVGDLEE